MKFEYPLKTPNILLTRKYGNNPLKMFGYYDGSGLLEVYTTSNDYFSSTITIDLDAKTNTYWYSCSRRKPNVADYKLTILRTIYCPRTNRPVIKPQVFSGFEVIYSPPEECND